MIWVFDFLQNARKAIARPPSAKFDPTPTLGLQDQPKPVVWTYYVVEPDPNGGYRLKLVDRKPKLELEPS